MTIFKLVWTPNEKTTSQDRSAILLGWAILWIALWSVWRPAVLPSPLDVLQAFPALWLQDGLGQEMLTSFLVNLQALAISTAIALPLSYLSVVPIFRPAAVAVTKLRFLSPSVFFLILLFFTANGHQLKVSMLVVGISCYLVTSMTTIVQEIPGDKFDDARTLRMSEWLVTWYVVVRGTAAQAVSAVRDCAAMSWAMLMMVEGIVRAEGGVGVMIITQQKFFEFSFVYAIALAILVVGLVQDAVIAWAGATAFPYSRLDAK